MATFVVLIALIGIVAMLWISSGARRHSSIRHQHERYQRERQRLTQDSGWPEISANTDSWLAPAEESAADPKEDNRQDDGWENSRSFSDYSTDTNNWSSGDTSSSESQSTRSGD